jgi:hypothetical protein
VAALSRKPLLDLGRDLGQHLRSLNRWGKGPFTRTVILCR